MVCMYQCTTAKACKLTLSNKTRASTRTHSPKCKCRKPRVHGAPYDHLSVRHKVSFDLGIRADAYLQENILNYRNHAPASGTALTLRPFDMEPHSPFIDTENPFAQRISVKGRRGKAVPRSSTSKLGLTGTEASAGSVVIASHRDE